MACRPLNLRTDIAAADAARVLEIALARWKSLIGVSVVDRDDGEPTLVVTLTKLSKSTSGRLPSAYLGYEVVPRLFVDPTA